VPFSYEEYDGDGLNRIFSVPFPYIQQQHVTVRVSGVSVPFIWLNPSQIQTSAAPAEGERNVRVKRTTPGIIATLSSPSIFRAATLNTIFRTLLYVSQEGQDAGGEALGAANRANTQIANLIATCVAAALTAVSSSVSAAIAAASSAISAATTATDAATTATNAAATAVSVAGADLSLYALKATVVSAGTGLSGGGSLATNRSLAVDRSVVDTWYAPAGSYALASHTHSAATGSVAGFMAAADKTKLDGLTQGFTTAGSGLSGSGATVSVNTNNSMGVGAVAWLVNNSTSVANGGTAAGSTLRVAAGNSSTGVVSARLTTQSGTWRNISGDAVGTSEMGLWIRTA
jgi:hypothetical protein